MLSAAGQAGVAVAKIEAKLREVVARTDELAQFALKLLNCQPDAYTDSERISTTSRPVRRH